LSHPVGGTKNVLAAYGRIVFARPHRNDEKVQSSSLEGGHLRNKKVAIAVAVLIAIVAIAAPILMSLYLAWQQSIAEQEARVAQLAQDVLRRSDQTTNQLHAAIEQLEANATPSPCSADSVALMARLTLISEQLQGMGHIAGDRLMCSSYSVYDPPAPVGPPDYTGANGSHIRSSVDLPSIPGTKFLLVTRPSSGFTAIVNPRLPLDVFVDDPDIAVGLVGYTSGKIIALRGSFDPSWLAALGDRRELEIFDGQHVVAIRRSGVGDFAAFAAIPADHVQAGLRQTAAVLLPIGAIAGAALAFAILYVGRLQLALPAALRVALRRNELSVEYQPVVDLQTGRWVGAEALVRWRRPDGENVRPEIFIPVAEDAGLIRQITERVVETVGSEAPGLFRNRPDFHVALNVSSADLGTDRIVGLLRRLAERTGAKPGNLIVEVTERGLIEGQEVNARLHDIRASGARVAIDDFGTGYSSLSYLRTFEVDLLKIDKTFIDTIGKDAVTSHVVAHIIEMARSLNLDLIAEGIETEGQRQFLREHGVHYGQGWLFAKAMPLADLLSRLAS
jgi:sensor c-di-GMP phosphodiesterase-like protein